MCVGIPAQVMPSTGEPEGTDLIRVDVAGAARLVNAGLLDAPPRVGDWVLVHMGFALSTMTAQEAADAMSMLVSMSDEWAAAAQEAGEQ